MDHPNLCGNVCLIIMTELEVLRKFDPYKLNMFLAQLDILVLGYDEHRSPSVLLRFFQIRITVRR